MTTPRRASSPSQVLRKLELCNEEKGRLKAQLSVRRADPWSGVVAILIQAIVWIILGVFALIKVPPTAVEIASVLAGKKTIAKFSLVFNVSIAVTLAFSFVVGWALMERRFRKKDVERLSSELIHVRGILDSRRGSSGLAPSGDTNEEDMP